MQTNTLPYYDDSINTTGCCAKFNPEGWDDQTLRLKDKPFVHATTISAAHIPLNMGKVFTRVQQHMADAGAQDPHAVLVLSRDTSAFRGEHYFAASADVPGEEMTKLSGDFVTKVFEGPYSRTGDWHDQMQALAETKGKTAKDIYFFYTTCPKCAKAYGQNYVVGLAAV
jgi:hypothetical protein